MAQKQRRVKRALERIAADHVIPAFAKLQGALPADTQRIETALRKALREEGVFILSFLIGRLIAKVGPERADELLSSLILAITERPV